jgi:phenylacetate-CoA ligase
MPLHKWIIGRRARDLYLWLKSIEFVEKSELEEVRFLRLQEMLYNCYLNVPYYRKVFDKSGFKPSDFQSMQDLSKVPLLSKDDVRENIHFDLFSSKHKKSQMHQINTSGSTGHPFVCYADKFQLEMRFATTMRALEMTGYRFGDKQLRLWHQTLGMSFSQVVREKIDAFFLRRKFIPAFEMTEHSIKSLIELIEKGNYKLVDGYAESLNFIASLANIQVKNQPRGVISSAQQLTPATRARIESLFGTKVYDKYGSREFSGIAYQCDQSSYHHVQDESYVVELLVEGRPALPGEVGEIVITDLNNFSVPLIRYRIGDLAVAVEQENCKCGRPHSLIGEITGRTQAMIGCGNGVWLPGGFFGHFFKDYDYCIKHYQVVQEKFGEFILKIVPTHQFTEASNREILESLHKYAGHETRIEIELVSEIPLIRTGKRSPVISSLRPNMSEAKNIVATPID